MYCQDDIPTRELYTIPVTDGEIVYNKYVWAYTFSEACEICESEGLEVVW